jgi:hypothetical protein
LTNRLEILAIISEKNKISCSNLYRCRRLYIFLKYVFPLSPDIMTNIKVNTIVVTFAAVTLSLYGLTNLIFAQGSPTIPVSLSGNEEVPPVQTEATNAAYIVQIGIKN